MRKDLRFTICPNCQNRLCVALTRIGPRGRVEDRADCEHCGGRVRAIYQQRAEDNGVERLEDIYMRNSAFIIRSAYDSDDLARLIDMLQDDGLSH
jgi:RNase P subunit RPR2